MRIVLLTYATGPYVPFQVINTRTALRAGFDEVLALGPDAIDPGFARENAAVLGAARGAGFWLWKPYLVARTLEGLSPGDLLVYSDAGAHFVGPARRLAEALDGLSTDLLVLGEGFRESRFTKRDAFVLMDCDREPFVASPQRFASFFVLRAGDWAARFASEYLRYALDPRILTDRPNEAGLPDYPDFQDHRHDQSVFSLLSKRLGVPCGPPGLVRERLAPPEGQVINHTRLHEPPGRVIQHLLAHGVLRVADLAAFGGPDGA